MKPWTIKGSNVINKIQRAFSFFSFQQEKRIVEIKILYNILIVYVHKIILLITKLKSLICRIWLATPKTDPITCSFWSRAGSKRTLANTPLCLGVRSGHRVMWLAFSSCVVYSCSTFKEGILQQAKWERRHVKMNLEMPFKICIWAMVMVSASSLHSKWVRSSSLIHYSCFQGFKSEWIPARGKDSFEKIRWVARQILYSFSSDGSWMLKTTGFAGGDGSGECRHRVLSPILRIRPLNFFSLQALPVGAESTIPVPGGAPAPSQERKEWDQGSSLVNPPPGDPEEEGQRLQAPVCASSFNKT